MFQTVTIVGVGLISGSLAFALKEKGLARKIIGVSRTEASIQKALQRGFIDATASLEEAVAQSDLIYVAIPVSAATPMMKKILDLMRNDQILADAGSTKDSICAALANHPMRGRWVATHPMWGTEHSGPEAATHDAFRNRACVICEKEQSDIDALQRIEQMYRSLGMHLVYMDARSHDVHAAYVSHISHITSFALANTVLEKEKETDAIFQLAGGGFESTVRLAKSSPAMWTPIFLENRENVLDVLDEHILQLRQFRSSIDSGDEDALLKLMENANRIKRIL